MVTLIKYYQEHFKDKDSRRLQLLMKELAFHLFDIGDTDHFRRILQAFKCLSNVLPGGKDFTKSPTEFSFFVNLIEQFSDDLIEFIKSSGKPTSNEFLVIYNEHKRMKEEEKILLAGKLWQSEKIENYHLLARLLNCDCSATQEIE